MYSIESPYFNLQAKLPLSILRSYTYMHNLPRSVDKCSQSGLSAFITHALIMIFRQTYALGNFFASSLMASRTFSGRDADFASSPWLKREICSLTVELLESMADAARRHFRARRYFSVFVSLHNAKGLFVSYLF